MSMKHVLMWKSSTGKLDAPERPRTHEHTTWSQGVPQEFLPYKTVPWRQAREHSGISSGRASRGNNTDYHVMVPPMCAVKVHCYDGQPMPDGLESAKWA